MTDRLPGLQAARFLAALAVAYFHSYIAVRAIPAAVVWPFAPLASGGFLGVNFFFAVSGFVICLVTDRPHFTARSFVIKRVFRLYPLVILFCLVQYAVHVTNIATVTNDHSLGRMLYGMSLLPGAGERYYAVTWTLEHELIFYAMAAAIVPLFGRWGLALALAALTAAALFFKPTVGSAHIFTPLHADFLAGVLVYQCRDRLRILGTWAPIAAGLALYWFGYRGLTLGVALGSVLLLAGLLNATWNWDRWPLRGAVILGDASYSIYLSHWIAFYVANRVAWSLQIGPAFAEPWRFVTLAAVCLLSVALWYGFEKPINAFGARLASPRRIVRRDERAGLPA